MSDRLEEKIDTLSEKVNEINIRTIQNTLVLEEHARRSLASEARHDVAEERMVKFEEEVKPVLDSVRGIKGIFMLLSGVLVIIQIIAAFKGK